MNWQYKLTHENRNFGIFSNIQQDPIITLEKKNTQSTQKNLDKLFNEYQIEKSSLDLIFPLLGKQSIQIEDTLDHIQLPYKWQCVLHTLLGGDDCMLGVRMYICIYMYIFTIKFYFLYLSSFLVSIIVYIKYFF